MAVIDENGRGWISDPETGEIVEFGTPRSMAIRAKEFEDIAEKHRKRIVEETVTDIAEGKVMQTARKIAELFRKAERGEK